MNKDKRNYFQIVTVVVCIAVFILAILVFAGKIKIGNSNSSGSMQTVTVWGVLPEEKIQPILEKNVTKTLKYTYRQVSSESFRNALLESIANANGPDLLLFDTKTLYSIRDKVSTIPYATYPEATFRQTYIDGADILLNQTGTYGLPLLVDPMVIYYNRDIFARAGFANPITSWDELYTIVPSITKKNSNNTFAISTIPFGLSENVSYNKDMLVTLLGQAGVPVVYVNNNVAYANLVSSVSENNTAGISMLDFYMQFSNPTSDYYSWNKLNPDAKIAFVQNSLAIYPGYASELFELRQRNPNLNFAPALMRQFINSNVFYTTGYFYAIGVSSSSLQPTVAYSAMYALTTPEVETQFAQSVSLPPANRDLLSLKPETTYAPVFYKSALFTHGWLDPNSSETKNRFASMVSDVVSGRLSESDALNKLERELNAILNP
ncbi:MAG: ABC transporter substrate-binding protein [Minisyncoccia bacterium]